MKKINLYRFPRIGKSDSVKRLNRMIRGNRRLMLHQIAVATGCKLDEAMGFVYLVLYEKGGEAFILVFHITEDTDPPVVAARRPVSKGLPPLPFICNNCGLEIDDPDELSFELELQVSEDVLFVSEHIYAQY
jgi:hypothetical protein